MAYSFKFVKQINAYKIINSTSELAIFTIACMTLGPVHDGHTKTLKAILFQEDIHDNSKFREFDNCVKQKFPLLCSPLNNDGHLRMKLKYANGHYYTSVSFASDRENIPTIKSIQSCDPVLLKVHATYVHSEFEEPTYTIVVKECLIY
jgi:hypothetical protein